MKQENKGFRNISNGILGEDIAENYLKNKGFSILGRNYRKPWGEIDVICKKDNQYHFIEVKTVSYKTFEENENNIYLPEENLTINKLEKLLRVIDTYTKEYSINNWQIDLVTVRINETNKKAFIKYFPSISKEDFI